MRTTICLLMGLNLLAASAAAQLNYDSCGRLVRSGDCVVFRGENGARFVLDDYGDFEAGDDVRVIGQLRFDCLTICQNVAGCIEVSQIIYCDGPVKLCGRLVQGVECVLFEDDKGFLFAIDRRDSFLVGERVRIEGEFTQDCFTICQQTDGCVTVSSIRAGAPGGSCEDGSFVCPAASLGLVAAASAVGLARVGRRGRAIG